MGIRFDKDSAIAINSPVIFFSDPVSLGNLKDEINKIADHKLSFYAYRQPGDYMISFGVSEKVTEGFDTPGFIISDFLPDKPIINIPFSNKGESLPFKPSLYESEKEIIIKNEDETYFKEINSIKEAIKNGQCRKVVAAREIRFRGSVDIGFSFINLCKLYPEAYIYCFSTPFTGCWLGASPELMLQAEKNKLKSFSLAGTKILDDTSEWDEKNKEEQSIVTQYISELFKEAGLKSRLNGPFEKKAGKLLHLCTEIESHIEKELSSKELENFLKKLSPTPALCGCPKDSALKIIMENEPFSRECYGGFCGMFHNPSDFVFNVMIRCSKIGFNKFSIFAGGGITSKSEPQNEFYETERKAETILKALKLD